jgi:heptose I phosphotransferase
MNRETFWQRLARGCRRLHERPDWERFVGPDWAERIMALAVTDRYHAKQGRSTGRLILQADGKQLAVYLKRHYRLPWWRGLLAALWPDTGWSPALEEWQHLDWARRRGLSVPASVAAGEYIGPWGRLQSFLAVEELADMLPLHEAIPEVAATLDAITFQRWKRSLIVELARLTRELHGRRWFHKDLYLCHFYIPRTDAAHIPDWRGRVHLIDLHRLAHHRLTWPLWQTKDLAELLYSSHIAGITLRDRVRFWRDYLGPDRRPWISAWLRRGILFKWRLYERHSRRRQRGART